MRRYFGMALILVCSSVARAADSANDSASDAQYTVGANFHGVNGGSGFAAWENTPAENYATAGHLIGDATANGGSGPGINSAGDVAFGLYAGPGELAEARRTLIYPLRSGQTLSLGLDPGATGEPDAVQGLALLDTDGVSRFEIFVRADGGTYLINDSESEVDTGVAVGENGIVVSLTLTAEDTYDLQITDLDSADVTTLSARSLGGQAGSQIGQLRIFVFGNNGNPAGDLFANTLAVQCADDGGCQISVEGSACQGEHSSFNGPDDAESYAWSIENNTSGAELAGPDNEMGVLVYNGSEVGTYDLVLTITVGGCESVCSQTITVGGPPAPDASNSSPICEGEDLTLAASSIDNATYTWTGPDSFSSDEQNPTIAAATKAAEGEYSVSATVNGCPSAISTTYVTVREQPECLISGAEVVCPGTEEVIYYAPNDLTSYEWSISGNAVLEGDANGGFVRVIPEESGSYVLSLVIRQSQGCEVFCEKEVTIGDSEPPELICPDDLILSPGSDTSPASTGEATAQDICDPEPAISHEDEIAPGGCEGALVITRTWTAVDATGNSASCAQTITVQDTEPPQLEVPPEISLPCGSDTSPEATGYATASDDTDLAPSLTFEDQVYTIDCDNQYIIERIWTATDACGNMSEDLQVIFVDDLQGPDLVVPPDVTIEVNDDSSPESLGQATATDNCDAAPTVTHFDEIIEGACSGQYTIQRTWIAQDSCGGESEGVQTITVGSGIIDLTVPADSVVNCGDDTSAEALGEATAVNGSGQTLAVQHEDEIIPADCAGRYIINRTWRAEDDCANSASAVQTIVVDDLVAPTLTPPADAEVECGGDLSADALGYASATDGCDNNPVVTFTDQVGATLCGNSYDVARIWRATDQCGNIAEVTQTIRVRDQQAPELTVPADVTVGCGVSTDPANTGEATANDNCSASVAVTYSDETSGPTLTRTWTAVDECDNSASAIQTITTSGGGSTAPTITSPGDQVVSIACGEPVSFQEPTASSECDPNPTVVCAPPSGSALGAGSHVITCTATDSAGNQSTTTFTVKVMSPLRVVFASPLADDNVANAIETDSDVVNKFKSGKNVPHKIKLYDCNGQDVTASMASLVKVRLDVTLRLYTSPGHSIQLLDMWENYSGLGGPNGQMVLAGGHYQYNLKTFLYLPNTIAMPWFFRSRVTVEYLSAPGVIVGEEDALLESKF